MLEAMTLLTAAWECVSPITLVNCFRKADISSESQARSQSDDDDPFKLLAAELEEFQGRCESSLDFTVDGYVDADKDVATSEVHFLPDSEIIARVTQPQLGAAEDDDENEDAVRDIPPPRRDQVHEALKFFSHAVFTTMMESRRCGIKWQRKRKLCEISLLK